MVLPVWDEKLSIFEGSRVSGLLALELRRIERNQQPVLSSKSRAKFSFCKRFAPILLDTFNIGGYAKNQIDFCLRPT